MSHAPGPPRGVDPPGCAGASGPGLRHATRCAALLAALLTLAGCGGGDDGRPDAAGAERKKALAAVTTLAVPITAEADPMLANLVIPADAATRGMWSATQSWPMNGLHAVLLPNGKVLTCGTPANTPDTQDGRTYDLWTPSLGCGAASHATTTRTPRSTTRPTCSAASTAWRSWRHAR